MPNCRGFDFGRTHTDGAFEIWNVTWREFNGVAKKRDGRRRGGVSFLVAWFVIKAASGGKGQGPLGVIVRAPKNARC